MRDPDNPELDWTHATRDIAEGGLAADRSATAEERDSLARRAGIPAVEALTARYRISPRSGRRYRLSGRLTARVVQACVATLEPVESLIAEPLEVEFWPAADVASHIVQEVDALTGDDPEPIENERLHVGRYVYQVLASSLDPYPRRPEAATESPAVWSSGTSPAAPEGPFAALRRLRPDAEDQ